MVHAKVCPKWWIALVANLVSCVCLSVVQAQAPAAAPATPAAPVARPAAAPAAALPPGKFKEDPVDPKITDKVEKDLISKRKQAGQKPEFWPAVKEYYLRAILPRMTQVDALDQLAASRAEFLRDVDKSVEPTRAEMLQLAYQWAGKVAMDVQYHPAVRINATFILADLEETKLVSGGAAPAPPTPYEPSLGALVSILTDAKSNDGMRVAAIYGLNRYIKLATSAPGRQNAAIKLMAILSEPCPSGRDRQAHAWMQAMALEGLMHHEGLRGNAMVAQQVLKLANNKDEPAFLRVKAAEIIGTKLAKPKDVAPPVVQLDVSYKALIAKVFEHEAARLENLEKKPIVGATATGYEMSSGYDMSAAAMPTDAYGPMMGYGAVPGAMPVVPQAPDVIMSRRRVNWLLEGLHTSWDGRKLGSSSAGAKTGIAAWVGNGPGKVEIETAIKLINDLQTEMNDLSLTQPAAYAVKLREKAALLVGAPVPPTAPPGAPAEPGAATDGSAAAAPVPPPPAAVPPAAPVGPAAPGAGTVAVPAAAPAGS
jgi:hypothetical protein